MVKGVREYGEGKWVKILEDDRFKDAVQFNVVCILFLVIFLLQLKNLDNRQLKDKYRNLRRYGDPLLFENIDN